MQSKLCMWFIWKSKTLMHSSIIAAIIIAAVIGVSMVTGFSGINPFASADPVSDTNTAASPAPPEPLLRIRTQFIRIDPVADKTTGDLLIVSGSTNLPAGTILMVQAGGDGIGYAGDTIVGKARAELTGFPRLSIPPS